MDTAMRDLDQLRERGDDTTGRKLGLFAMAGLLSVAAVFAMGIMVGRGGSEPQPGPDPLAQLAMPAAQAKGGDKATPETVEVRPEALSFPATLSERDDDRLVEASVRAAELEHQRLSTQGLPAANAVPPIPVAPLTTADLPAAAVASTHADRLERVAQHDPLVARALPKANAPEQLAPSGSDGAFVLQVVSYDSADNAERFANTLRARGHRAFVVQADVPGRGRFHRVRVGPFKTRQEAIAYQRKFESTEHMHTLVVANPTAE